VTRDAVIERAEELLDERGLAALTLAEVASTLGIRQPSLYKHVGGQAEVLRELATRARLDLGAALARAAVGRSGDEAVRALAVAYRDWARAHPGRYEATVRAPHPDDAAGIRSSAAVVEVVVAVLAGYGLLGADAIDSARALRSALHGFVSIELAHGFGLAQDVDRSFALMVDAMTRSLATWDAAAAAR
jgi:AcrR family transcriptional regulator